MRRLFLLLIGLLMLAACGDDGPSLEERSQGYIDAINTGDADAAWEYRSDRCQDGQEREQFDSLMVQVPEQYPDIERLDYSESFTDDGDTAIINSTLNYSNLNDSGGTRWSRIDGEWYWDDC